MGGLNTKLTLGDCFFGALIITKSSDLDKYGYRGYGIEFHTRSNFSINSEFGKNVISFGKDNIISAIKYIR